MQNVHKYAIICTFFGLWLVPFISAEFQVIVAFFFIFTFGILHGTNDLLLISAINENDVVSYYRILINYLLVIIATVIVLKYFPLVTLLLFISFSAYHFGEQHFDYLETHLNKFFVFGFQFLYGLFVLAMLFYANASEVSTVISDITAVSINQLFFYNLMFIVGFLLVIFSVYIGSKSSSFLTKIIVELFYLLIFLIIFKSTTLIWGFALYFILWHSIPSMLSQIDFLYGANDKKSFFKYFKAGVLFWFVSML